MKKYINLIVVLLLMAFVWNACEDYATSVDPLIDRVEDERLNDQNQINFVINGVKTQFALTHDVLMMIAGLLSDELFFDSNIPNATYPTFADIDVGEITLDNNSVDGPYNNLGELRFFADDLLRRVNTIDFTDADLKNEAQFTGYMFGGIARYLYAAYFGLNPNEGGGVIDNGPFIPSAQMYEMALAKLDTSLMYTTDAYNIRVVNSLIARIYLLEGDYANAQTAAQKGMISGDEPFQAKHSVIEDNYFWQQAGPGRTQAVAAWRLHDYVIENPEEWARVKLDSVMGNNDVLYYRQGKYLNEEAPIDFMTWQENELMLAELDIRNNSNASALTRINNVRDSHGISPLDAVDMNVLITERDKELCFTGARLLDERRFNIWHLPAGTWEYFPITERERNINPNID